MVQGKRILVVEDSLEQAEALREFFEFLGYSVTTVGDGLDVISEVLAGDYQLITMDLVMPGMGGVRATELLRLEHGIHTPVVVVSGRLDQRSRAELEALGVVHFVDKPVDLGRLRQIVEAILEPGAPGRKDQQGTSAN